MDEMVAIKHFQAEARKLIITRPPLENKANSELLTLLPASSS
jgi:uncharacterized protein YggU (UPF0235/DUF167 family)